MDKKPSGYTVGGVIGEVSDALKSVIANDVNLAREELKETTGRLKGDVIQVPIFGLVAALGILPFMAFLVIGLGELLGWSFWLSSLIVSIVCFAVGGGMAYRAINHFKKQDFSFPRTRGVVEQEVAIVQRRLRSLAVVKDHALSEIKNQPGSTK